MLAIEEAKFAPPTPALPAQASSTQNCVAWRRWASQWLGTTRARSSAGSRSSSELAVVHALPPNLGTAKVYGMRSKEPIRFGASVRKKEAESDRLMPALGKLTTTTVHMVQVQKAT